MADNEERRLRRDLSALERGPGKRYPRELRARVAAWARREIGAGRGFHGLARRLALHPQSLKAWLEDAAVTGALVPIEIVEAAATDAPRTDTRALCVVTPRGLRIEGLMLDEVATLLARFG